MSVPCGYSPAAMRRPARPSRFLRPALAGAAVALAFAAAGCGGSALELHDARGVRVSGDAFVYDCGGRAHRAPARLALVCWKHTLLVVTSLRWRGWGSPEPTATGLVARRTCPRCAPERGARLPVTLRLEELVLRPGARLVYTSVRVQAREPVLGRGPEELVFDGSGGRYLQPLSVW